MGLDSVYVTTGMSIDKCDPETLIKNLWGYLVGYEEQPPPLYLQKPLLHILREALAILQSESTVIDLQGVVTIIGGVHGHGDSLTYHMSYSGLPPSATYIFLGNYVGEGFAPHECLFLLLALKVKFPKHIYLLKGCFEDPEVLKELIWR
uniref:protein-serine/threonine phosphatase n=1 Tax=Panagrolaimus superbus TaxID=310955 RepID=A0A914Y476_9BILA